MGVKIALAGNPNSGKTTVFNDLTGSTQRVGNWPGVTVEKKEGKWKDGKEVLIQDLPGIYSLSPYTLEEVITRDYLMEESPDAILNIIDGSNLERNLYLTTQLLETGIPVVIALNMMDMVRKNRDVIRIETLKEVLGCEVIETTALKREGTRAAIVQAEAAAKGEVPTPLHVFGGQVEHTITYIEDILGKLVEEKHLRWYAIKLFERDEKVVEQLSLDTAIMQRIEKEIMSCEVELDDDAESIITNERYAYITGLIGDCLVKKQKKGTMSTSDRIDRVVTNRWLALPIFMAVMVAVYAIAVTTVGGFVTDFTNETLFGEWVQGGLQAWLPGIGVADWLVSLLVDGIVAGVGAVLGFVPQLLILFLMLSILENIGYMARVAFIMDRIFRRFGLSGKSFIPMLIGSGCSVPGIMASRTIENERDRRMTIITTSFIPCGAKLPVIALIAGMVLDGLWWITPAMYFIGIAAVIISGIILKKTKRFAGDPALFVMELPAYRIPSSVNVLRSTWERGWSFIKRAGTVILMASIVLWFLAGFGVENGTFGMVEDMDHSVLAVLGNGVAFLFAPLGFGNWQATVGTVTGLVAKEEVVSTFGVLFRISGDALQLIEEGAFHELAGISGHFTALSGMSFLLFNLLCAPCFAAMGAMWREMNSGTWTLFGIAYQCVFAYAVAFVFFQLGTWFTGGTFGIGTGLAIGATVALAWLLIRPQSTREHIADVSHANL